MNDSQSALTERIAFAEEWLDRAKRQLADGNVTHGSLHLILAEAELQRAREVISPTAAMALPPRSWSGVRARAVVGVVAVASFAAALLWHVPVMRDAADAQDSSWPVVVFSGQTGDMLRIVSAPAAPPEPMIVERTVERTILKPVIVRMSAVPRRSAPAAASASRASVAPPAAATRAPGLPSAAATQPAPASAAQPATVEAPPAAPVLSDAEVIDLVLAAERSLRQPAKH